MVEESAKQRNIKDEMPKNQNIYKKKHIERHVLYMKHSEKTWIATFLTQSGSVALKSRVWTLVTSSTLPANSNKEPLINISN